MPDPTRDLPKRTIPKGQLTETLIRYLHQYPGHSIDVQTLEGVATGIRPESIGRALREYSLIHPDRLQVVQPGRVWRWIGATNGHVAPAKSGKRVFGEVGATKDEALVLECTDGTLWKAVQL